MKSRHPESKGLTQLTVELEEAKDARDNFKFPCPDCKMDMKGARWDLEEGGECPHCHALVEPKEVAEFVEKQARLWESFLAKKDALEVYKRNRYEKELLSALPDWEKFLHGGLLRHLFTPRLYRTLRETFGHIAHYDLDGFYSCRFSTMPQSLETLLRMKAWRNGTYLRHLHEQIILTLDKSEAIGNLERSLSVLKQEAELKLYAELKAKYG